MSRMSLDRRRRQHALPLDSVSGRLTEKEIRLWIVAPQEMNPAVAKRGYQLSEEDLNALVAYLAVSSHR